MTMLADRSFASNGFFGAISEGLGKGLGKVVSDVLPVWVSDQLGVDPQSRITNPLNTSMGNISQVRNQGGGPMDFFNWGGPQADPVFMDVEGDASFTLPPNTIIAGGIVIVGLIILFKVL